MAKLVPVEDLPQGARLVAVEDDKPDGVKLNELLGDVSLKNAGRQLGLTARAGLEGLGTLPQILGGAMESLGVKGAGSNVGKSFSDYVGLPTPQNSTERTAQEGAKLLAPAGGFIGLGNKLAKSGGMAGAVGETLAANPAAQLQSAAGAGGAGGYIKENGGNEASQIVAALAGGVAAPTAISAIRNSPNVALNASKSFVEKVAPGLTNPVTADQAINITINNALRDSGITLDKLPAQVSSSIRRDVATAMQQGTELNGDALRRLIDYRLTGAIPRNANLTLDPVALTQQKNLAKVGANSKDASAQLLARADHENNATLISNLDNLGAGSGIDSLATGEKVINRVGSVNDMAKGVIGGLYDKAKNAAGRDIELDRSFFTNRVDELLAKENKHHFLPDQIRNMINDFAIGQKTIGGKVYDSPFNVNVVDAFKTDLASAQRSTQDGSVKKALSLVRQAIDETPAASGLGEQALNNFNRARSANARWMNVVDRTPALQAVRDGVEPDKFVSQYIIGQGNAASTMSVAQLKNLVKGSPDTMQSIRGAIADHLKSKAIGNAVGNDGNFSPSNYNAALKAIGERKLSMFFSKEEVEQLKAIGRVAHYENFQPRGSAVNNSNTAAGMAGLFERIANSPLLSKIPLGKMIAEPAQNISVGMQSNRATNIPYALVNPVKKTPALMNLSPALGLLSVSE